MKIFSEQLKTKTMAQFLLKYKQNKIASEERNQNISNGNDAEMLAASLLIMAMGTEITWGSRNEDGRKIDVIGSYDHPWFSDERLIFFVQVKSGGSFGEKEDNGFKLKTKAKDLAKRTTHPICIVWVDRKSNQSFWAYVHPSTESKVQHYGNSHKVLPTMRYDLARCQSQFLPMKKGGGGIIINERDEDTFSVVRKNALMKYKSYKGEGIFCPSFGNVEITRIGWRHMFRKTRKSINKHKSCIIINYLDKILGDIPSDIYMSKCDFFESNDCEYRNSEYVLIYDNIKKQGEANSLKSIKTVIRIIEEIRWPLNWSNNSTLTQLIERRVVLLSCYYK